MRTRSKLYLALIVLGLTGAGCALESPMSPPNPVAPPFMIAADDTLVDAAFLERLATRMVSHRCGDDRVLMVVPAGRLTAHVTLEVDPGYQGMGRELPGKAALLLVAGELVPTTADHHHRQEVVFP